MSLAGLTGGTTADISTPQCSRAGCTADGSWVVRWRNPKLHAADRVKQWLACDAHHDFLREFVAARGFLIEVHPLGRDA